MPDGVSVPSVTFVPVSFAGSPSTGTWHKGQGILDTNNVPWVCTVSGSPGTWEQIATGTGGGVTSVFTRTGAVTAQTGDYTAAQVTNAADKASGSTQAFTGPVSSANSVLVIADNGTGIATPAVGFYRASGNLVLQGGSTGGQIQVTNNGLLVSAAMGIDANPPIVGGTIATSPPSSATIQTALGNLALGTAFHNTLSYDVNHTVNLAITANTSLVVSDGVGTTNTPTQTVIITGTVATGIIAIKVKIPAGQWRLLSVSGVGTDAIAGQYLEAA